MVAPAPPSSQAPVRQNASLQNHRTVHTSLSNPEGDVTSSSMSIGLANTAAVTTSAVANSTTSANTSGTYPSNAFESPSPRRPNASTSPVTSTKTQIKEAAEDKGKPEKKKKNGKVTHPNRAFPRRSLWTFSLNPSDLLNDYTTIEDSTKYGNAPNYGGGKIGGYSQSHKGGHRGSTVYAAGSEIGVSMGTMGSSLVSAMSPGMMMGTMMGGSPGSYTGRRESGVALARRMSNMSGAGVAGSGRRHSNHSNVAASHRRLSVKNRRGSSPTSPLGFIDEGSLEEELDHNKHRRDLDVAGALNAYRAQLAEVLKMRDEFPHNNAPEPSETSESEEQSEEESEIEANEGEAADEDAAALQKLSIDTFGVGRETFGAALSLGAGRKGNASSAAAVDEEIDSMTPQQILADLSSTYCAQGTKQNTITGNFRACHALSMRRKISSYHRNGVPSAMRGRSGRRGSAFDNSKFMKSRRVSKTLGLDPNGLGNLHTNGLNLLGLSNDSVNTTDSPSDNDDDPTTSDMAEHYHSYHLYDVFESLHKPRIEGRPGSARTHYLRACEEERTVPLPIFDHIRQNALGLVDMRLSRYGIGDKATVALGAFLENCPLKVNSLEVSHNSIHNRGMTMLVKATSVHTTMKLLDLSANEVKRSAVIELSKLFTQPEPVRLVELRLSSCKIGDHNLGILASSIKESSSIRTLKLDRNNLSMCGSELALLLEDNTCITDLDLSWNQIRTEEATAVAYSLRNNDTITSLNLSWNNFGYDSAIFGIARFIVSSEVLHTLDVSYNKVKERGCITIADALKQNDSIKTLNMDGNPVGPTGGRALLKMIATDGNMRNISLEQCNFEVPDDGPIPFDINEPNGFYILDLSIPYDRMIATSLQELAYTQGGECWRGEKLNGEFFDFPESDPSAWTVPEEGILEFAFVANKPIENSAMNEDQFKMLKNQLSRYKKNDDREASSLVKSLSDTFAFNSSQVGEMIDEFENSSSKVIVATRLFTQVSDTDNAEKLLSKLNQLERKQVEKRLGQFYYFNSKNPTGHYRLNLSTEFERLVAVRVCEVNNTEKLAQRLEGKIDLTQKGNWENIRNETYDGEPFVYTSSWKIPDRGIFEFDFVSTVRPESEAEEMTDEDFAAFKRDYVTLESKNEISEGELREIFLMFDDDGDETVGVEELAQILKSLGQVVSEEEVQKMFESMDDDGSGSIEFEEFILLWESILRRVREQDRLITLRRKSSNYFVSAEQIREMLENFHRPLERVELFVIFFCRLVDEENMHIALNELSRDEREAVQHRLGALNLFNPFQPDGRYSLDLGQHDTRLLAEILIKLGIGETGKTLRDEFYNGFGFQLPVSWMSSVPRKGIYDVTFATPQPMSKEARKTKFTMSKSGFSEAKAALEDIAAEDGMKGDDDDDDDDDLEDYKLSPRTKAAKKIARLSRSSRESNSPNAASRSVLGSMSPKGKNYRTTFTGEQNTAAPHSSGHAHVVPQMYNDPNRYQGNLKLRRMVAEELLGWEFKEEDNEADGDAQKDAMARRRSSLLHNTKLSATELEIMLNEKVAAQESEKKITFEESGTPQTEDGSKENDRSNSRKSKWDKIEKETGAELTNKPNSKENSPMQTPKGAARRRMTGGNKSPSSPGRPLLKGASSRRIAR